MLGTCLNTLSKNDKKELPIVVDLFSGCGGLSLGFLMEGFSIAGGIEMSKPAADNASYNLHWRYGNDKEHICGDIQEISPNIFNEHISGQKTIVIGGPPCQAYSLAGRSKLKSLGEERIHTNDSRGYLFEELLRYAFELNATAVVMENVTQSANYGGKNIPQHVCELLEKKGYIAYWTVLNAANYGVPQTRERVFVMGVKKERFSGEFQLPEPTHRNFNASVDIWDQKFNRFKDSKNFKIPINPKKASNKWVTVGDALSDLPSLFKTSKSNYKIHKPNLLKKYSKDIENEYQSIMRNWFDKETIHTSGHGFRRTIRDYPIFEKMKPGDDYRMASTIADKLLEEECEIKDIIPSENSQEYIELKKSIVPPYNRETFHSRWKRLDSNKPSHTLVAHLGTDTYSHIHPWEPRGISVREAARLQSFPDGFLFQTPMGESFKQIGNAVPPLLSKAVAKAMSENII